MRLAPLVILAFGLAACADPAAVDVRIGVEEPEVDTVAVVVRVDGATRIDCRLPLDGDPEGACPFTDGEGRWTDPERLAFVLYGEPGRPFDIDVTGLRDGISVTATAAQSSLPTAEGERRALDLGLLGRTRKRFSCELILSEGLPPAETVANEGSQSALVVVSRSIEPRAARFAPLLIITSSRNGLALVEYARTPTGCELREQPLVDQNLRTTPQPAPDDPQRWCNLRGGTLVARPVAGANNPIFVAGVCANGREARLKVGVIRDDGTIDVGTFDIPAPPIAVSDPVLADTDGDGVPEAVVVYKDAMGAVSLGRLFLSNGGPRTSADVLIGVAAGGIRPFAPLVFPTDRDGTQSLLIAGHGGAMTAYVDGTQQRLRARNSLRPPVAYLLGEDRFGLVTLPTANRAALLSLSRNAGMWVAGGTAVVELSGVLSPTFDAAITMGQPDLMAAPQVALLEDGVAHLAPIMQGPGPSEIDVFGGAASDAQLSLWANLDGEPGAELLAFDPAGDAVAAVHADGTRVLGWPLDLPTSGAPRRVVLADLDGPASQNEDGLRDLEVVSLTDRLLHVVTLGPGSYDVLGMDWPSAKYTPHGSSVWQGATDPVRTLKP